MRTAFADTLLEMAQADPRVNLVVGDLGYSFVEEFAGRFPTRFLNAGVAEQNMTGLAAGLALSAERIVFTYSIANFPVVRCLEQIRNDVCYHRANVKIVSVGGGLAYGPQGHTHFAVEDLALMRAMPGMVVAAPADPVETRAIVRRACATPGPWYIRLGKDHEPNLHTDEIGDLHVGRAIHLFDGSCGTLITTGAVAVEAYEAAQQLAEEGLRLGLVLMPFVKPIDVQAVMTVAHRAPWIMTIEEHSGFGGLGSAVAEVLAQSGTGTPLHRLHLPQFVHGIGSQRYLRRVYGIDAKGIIEAVRRQTANALVRPE